MHIVFLLMVIAVDVFLFFVLQKEERILGQGWEFLNEWFLIPQSVFYLLVAISGARIWLKPPCLMRFYVLGAWAVQIGLNVIWPLAFFYLPIPIVTPILFTLLLITLLTQIFYTFLLDLLAGYLLIPYFLMVSLRVLFHWALYIINIASFS